MRTKDIEVGAEYAQADRNYNRDNPDRVRVLETGVSYKSPDTKSKYYRETTKTNGVLVELLDDGGQSRVAGRTVYHNGQRTEEGEVIRYVVRPATILHTWEEEERAARAREERKAKSAQAKAAREVKLSNAIALFNANVPDDEGRLTISDYERAYDRTLGHTGVKLSTQQLEWVAARLAKLSDLEDALASDEATAKGGGE